MNQYRQTFQDKKNKVLELLNKTKTFLENHQSEEQAKSCLNLYQQVENGNFSIVNFPETKVRLNFSFIAMSAS